MTEWNREQAFARSIELWKKRGAEFDHLASCRAQTEHVATTSAFRALTASYGS
jgi:hypothetical protein